MGTSAPKYPPPTKSATDDTGHYIVNNGNIANVQRSTETVMHTIYVRTRIYPFRSCIEAQ